MPVKVCFAGNSHGGDDAIGPFLYQELKTDQRLKGLQLWDAGVTGLDLLSQVKRGDRLIIVDAVCARRDFGRAKVYKEREIESLKPPVSAHDLGMAQTIKLLRLTYPSLAPIIVIGISIPMPSLQSGFSDSIRKRMPQLKKYVLRLILKYSS